MYVMLAGGNGEGDEAMRLAGGDGHGLPVYFCLPTGEIELAINGR